MVVVPAVQVRECGGSVSSTGERVCMVVPAVQVRECGGSASSTGERVWW